jgi:hypothetical protein
MSEVLGRYIIHFYSDHLIHAEKIKIMRCMILENTIIATVGHTAAGKTTMLRYLCDNALFDINYINEGQIKRQLRPNYSTKDSLDEELRDKAYRRAIQQAYQSIQEEGSIVQLIDASFHRMFRRKWIYDCIQDSEEMIKLLWLFLYCPELSKVEKRINNRKAMIKAADNHADSVDIYKHIISQLEAPSLGEVPDCFEVGLIYINTDSNRIEKIEMRNCSQLFTEFTDTICSIIQEKLSIERLRGEN